MLKKQLIDDIILRISAAKPSDDLELEPKQLAFWIDQVLNAVVKASLDEKIRTKEGVDGEYIVQDLNLNVNTTQINDKTVFYISLTCEPMNLYRDGGIIRVMNSDGLNVVDKARVTDQDILKELRFSKPSLKNIQYTRIKDKIYFQGLTIDTYAINNFDVYYVPKTKALEELKDFDNIYVAEDLIPIIAEKITMMAKDELFNSVNDLTNDATDDKPKVIPNNS